MLISFTKTQIHKFPTSTLFPTYDTPIFQTCSTNLSTSPIPAMATSEPPDKVRSTASVAHSQGQPPLEHATTQQGTPISVLDISDTTTHDQMTSETLGTFYDSYSEFDIEFSSPSVKFSSPKSQECMAATNGLVTKTVSQPGPAIPQLILRHPPLPLSRYSTIGMENSAWSSWDFILGAGMIVIQWNTHKVVVLFDTQKKRWFFPWGRKHIGESLEEATLREAYEGVRMLFLAYFPQKYVLK